MGIVLSVDPGNKESAFCLYDTENHLPIEFGKVENQEFIDNDLVRLCCKSGIVIFEKVACMGMAVGETVFETVFWTGRFAERVISFGIAWDRIERKDIKMHLCGNMRAKDANIRQALIDRFGEPGTKKAPGVMYKMNNDERSALAIAITYAETRITSE